jgi:hypothetical protein
MKLKSSSLIIVSVVLTAVIYGCAGVEQRPVSPAQVVPPQAQVRKLDVEVQTPVCSWTYTAGQDGKPQKGSLKVLPPANGCTARDSTADELYVSDTRDSNSKKVLSAPAGLFVTEGSCRYCYVNSSGGMSCVTLPSC